MPAGFLQKLTVHRFNISRCFLRTGNILEKIKRTSACCKKTLNDTGDLKIFKLENSNR